MGLACALKLSVDRARHTIFLLAEEDWQAQWVYIRRLLELSLLLQRLDAFHQLNDTIINQANRKLKTEFLGADGVVLFVRCES